MPHRAVVQRLLLGAAVLLAGCTTPSDPAMTDRLDALMHDYAGNGPGASVLVIRDGKADRTPQLRFRRPRSEDADHAADQLPARFGQQAVHSARDPAARARTASCRLDDPMQALAADAAAGGRCDHDPPSAHAHLGPDRLRRRDGSEATRRRSTTRTCCSCWRSGPQALLRAGHELSLQQQRLCAAGVDRRARLRASVRGLSCARASSSRWA